MGLSHHAVSRFWNALNQERPLPRLPDDSLLALRRLFEMSVGGDYFSLGFQDHPDPWPRLATGLAPEYWQTRLAMELAGLKEVGGVDSGEQWYLDLETDVDGLHRIYWHSSDSIECNPLCRGLDTFLEYLALLCRYERDKFTDEEFSAATLALPGFFQTGRSDWDPRGDDGWLLYESIHDHPFALSWQSYREGEWIKNSSLEPCPSPSAKNRQWVAELLDYFVDHKTVLCPPELNETTLPHACQRLLRELRGYASSLAARTVPSLVTQSLTDQDSLIATAAQSWVSTFQAREVKS